MQASCQSPSLPSLLIILKRVARDSCCEFQSINIFIRDKFLFNEDFFNYMRVREVDVVIVEKAFELKENCSRIETNFLILRSVLLC